MATPPSNTILKVLHKHENLFFFVSALVCIVALFLVLAFSQHLFFGPSRQLRNSVGQLDLEMSVAEAESIIGEPADWELRYGSSRICYYDGGQRILEYDFSDFGIPSGGNVDSLEELYSAHGYAALAFDADGLLHAYTLIGEMQTIKSRRGAIPGSNLSAMIDSDFLNSESNTKN